MRCRGLAQGGSLKTALETAKNELRISTRNLRANSAESSWFSAQTAIAAAELTSLTLQSERYLEVQDLYCLLDSGSDAQHLRSDLR